MPTRRTPRRSPSSSSFLSSSSSPSPPARQRAPDEWEEIHAQCLVPAPTLYFPPPQPTAGAGGGVAVVIVDDPPPFLDVATSTAIEAEGPSSGHETQGSCARQTRALVQERGHGPPIAEGEGEGRPRRDVVVAADGARRWDGRSLGKWRRQRHRRKRRGQGLRLLVPCLLRRTVGAGTVVFVLVLLRLGEYSGNIRGDGPTFLETVAAAFVPVVASHTRRQNSAGGRRRLLLSSSTSTSNDSVVADPTTLATADAANTSVDSTVARAHGPPMGREAHLPRHVIEQLGVALAARAIRNRLQGRSGPSPAPSDGRGVVPDVVKGRFMDLTTEADGERVLESLFCPPFPGMENDVDDNDNDVPVAAEDDDDVVVEDIDAAASLDAPDDDVMREAVRAVQSLCVMGTAVGLKGPPEQLRRLVAHLDARNDPDWIERDRRTWDNDSVRRLKHRAVHDPEATRGPAMGLLSELNWKRAPAGAFDLLVRLGAWTRHEDLALLRSGFPLRFTEDELAEAQRIADRARAADLCSGDPDSLLGIRQDFRHMKVYTIDSASTSEIDDGVSVEVDRDERPTYWIHIADADRWTTPQLMEVAKKRITSLYIPTGSYPMFPPPVSTEVMSLRAGRDACALSLGVRLNDDGSVDPESIVVTPSVIRVTYRLTYDDVDEMLEEGTGYSEEWQLGTLLDGALKRRDYRMRAGSTESLVPNPIPSGTVNVYPDRNAPDGIGISLSVQVSHNAGKNQTASASGGLSSGSKVPPFPAPVSSAYLLVTELMILAGEAIAQWKRREDGRSLTAQPINGDSSRQITLPNRIRLPFRTQPPPDFKSRSRERRVMEDLLDSNVGNGYCHAWYTRRFLQSVKVSESPGPHSGLGLSCYVQWSSPIRRFTDLQVHACVKRYLRRKRLFQLLRSGETTPSGLDLHTDLGFPAGAAIHDDRFGGSTNGALSTAGEFDQDLNLLDGIGLVGAARILQRQSQQYWLFEYVRRQHDVNPDKLYSALVLGCVDPERQQYAMYVEDLGLEHRFTSPGRGRLEIGATLQLKVDSVSPRIGALSFVQSI